MNVLKLLRYSPHHTSHEILTCLAYQARLEDREIEQALINYRGSDRAYLIKKWIALSNIYDLNIH